MSTASGIAQFIRSRSKDDMDFVRAVNIFVEWRIHYVTTGGREVKSPERTLRENTGDCSEKALLKATMLQSQGIDARIVHGYLDGQYHDTVEVRLGKYCKLINPDEEDHFTKTGEGLAPGEVVVD